MAERCEIVVNGQRRVALPVAPEFPSRVSPGSGFIAEMYRLPPFELPDSWIPYYLIGLQFPRSHGTIKRFVAESGKLREEVIQHGDCHVVGPREVRRFRCDGECDVCLVSIEPAVLQEMTAGSPYRNPLELIGTNNGQDPVLKSLLLQIKTGLAEGWPSGPLLGEMLCTRLAEEAIRRYAIGRLRLDEYKGGLSGARLRLAREYIEEHLDANLETGCIAAVAGLSKYHFGKAFRQSTGMTLHRYVLARRLRRAQELLAMTGLPLAVVAKESGFSNQSHCTNLFRTRIGLSPRAYREMHRRVSVFPYRLVQAGTPG